jgi:carbonic anhydrase
MMIIGFKFKIGSEHQIDGKSETLEVHLVHQSKNSNGKNLYTVLGFMFKVNFLF